LGGAGFTPDSLEVIATVALEDGAITSSHLELKASIPGISEEKFRECADDAKANCPVSKVLNCNITLDASLV
jgi:osmotically inducible protein OsmC